MYALKKKIIYYILSNNNYLYICFLIRYMGHDEVVINKTTEIFFLVNKKKDIKNTTVLNFTCHIILSEMCSAYVKLITLTG